MQHFMYLDLRSPNQNVTRVHMCTVLPHVLPCKPSNCRLGCDEGGRYPPPPACLPVPHQPPSASGTSQVDHPTGRPAHRTLEPSQQLQQHRLGYSSRGYSSRGYSSTG